MERYYQESIECAPREELDKIQDEKLLSQVRHVWENVPYYRKKMEEASKEKELSGEVDKEAVGKYVLKSIDSEESIDEDLFGEDVYVVLNDDGTGYFDAEGEQIEIEWVDGAVKIMNDVFYYEKHGNDIVIEIYGITITFSKE